MAVPAQLYESILSKYIDEVLTLFIIIVRFNI